MLPEAFSRSAFLAAIDLQSLCNRLADELTTRVRAATDLGMELEWIVADLRAGGHLVRRWDTVIANWESKDDPYLWIWLEGVDDILEGELRPSPSARAGVRFRPRLPEQRAHACPLCGVTMERRDIRLAIRGHGSAVAPSVHVDFECPGLREVHTDVGARSLELQRDALVCTACGAGLLLPPRRS